MNCPKLLRSILLVGFLFSGAAPLFAANRDLSPMVLKHNGTGLIILLIIFVASLLVLALFLQLQSEEIKEISRGFHDTESKKKRFIQHMMSMDKEQLAKVRDIFNKRKSNSGGGGSTGIKYFSLTGLLFLLSAQTPLFAQFSYSSPEMKGGVFDQAGIIITILLILIPILALFFLLMIRIRKAFRNVQNKANIKEAQELAQYINELPDEKAQKALDDRERQLSYELKHNELSGNAQVNDNKGLISYSLEERGPAIVEVKKRAAKRPKVDPELSKLVLWYIICATIWLVFGTSIGEYAGIKLVSPDADQVSWLSFGRIRPVHTNSVFWGWASLGMLGLAYYCVPRVGNNKLYSLKLGWISLIMINFCVLAGSIALMAGINNGGGEFREYIWPIKIFFIIPVLLTLYNFLKTIAQRKTREIYIANWYIVAALIFGATIMTTAYLPFWQNGLGETIVQGYYMHQGVGMWFMMFSLGLIYYYLPQQLNRPIYSYSLGILAFWTQILFYTEIGSHHFIFSSIPWWLQTIAIIGSIGMIIPVAAGSTNFLMTFKGGWYKLGSSYTLPFFLVGIIFYFTGSFQGTAEAFRTTNLFWHFTDFTVAHSHLTMYGIITFILWACIYALVPRLTGKEPPQITVGAHFWLAFVGLLVYSIPLMIGGTLKGLMWMDGKPFIDSVVLSAPYWLWRAIGGSLMWLSHLVFAYNLYKMYSSPETIEVKDAAIEELAAVNA